ncbi:acyl-CoA dehydrogenase family protein [bacterium]|nr:acyl-CoA dehydrogenase family protein [bacterium]
MDYNLSEELLMIRDLARQVADERIRPVSAHHDVTGEFPWDIMKTLAEMDFFRVYIDEEFGGLGLGAMGLVLATEELSKACGGIALGFAATALGTMPLLYHGNQAQKEKYLPDLASGKMLAGFGLTEPDAGSDAGRMKTSARKEGNEYVLNGVKHFITNGSVAKFYTIIAQTNPSKGARGASAFIVEEGAPGFSYGKKEDKMGIRASATSELVFEDCRIPAENLIGREGMGFPIAMRTLDRSRPGVAAQALGIAQGAFDHAVAYSRQRVQFDQPISSFQGISFKLADMATKIEAARGLIYNCARMIDAGVKDISMESAMCKLYAGDVAMEVTTDAVQVFGGYGYSKEYPVEKYMRDAKITQIYEGTAEIQRSVIGKAVIKKAAAEARAK